MKTLNYKNLPRVEVSFQDDFCGYEREINLTPKYILRELEKNNNKPKIGDNVLLWEFEDDENGYLCNVGQILELTEDMKNVYTVNPDIKQEESALLYGVPFFVKINPDNFFHLKDIK